MEEVVMKEYPRCREGSDEFHPEYDRWDCYSLFDREISYKRSGGCI